MALVAAVLYSAPPKKFELSKKLPVGEFDMGLRKLAAQSRVLPPSGDKPSVSSVKYYLRHAASIVASKSEDDREDYERVFLENYYVAMDALDVVNKCLRGFSDLPGGRVPAVLEFARYFVKSADFGIDGDALKRAVDIYNSERPFAWNEICNLYPALMLALLEELTVYAAKIVKRAEIASCAAYDMSTGNIEREMLAYNSYVKKIYTTGNEAYASKVGFVCASAGINPERSASSDAMLLADYSGAVSGIIDALRSDFFTAEYLLGLSLSASVLSKSDAVNFSSLTVETKTAYMTEICRDAKRRKTTEFDRVRQLISLVRVSGRDLANFVIRRPKKYSLLFHAATVLLLSAVVCALSVIFIPLPYGIIVACFSPFISVPTVNTLYLYVLSRCTTRRIVPALKINEMPRTAMICCRMVTGKSELEQAADNLLTLSAANGNGLSYGLLLDAPESYASAPNDISDVFAKKFDGGNFFVCLRKRAWERKRGAIIDFNNLVLNGSSDRFSCVMGEIKPFKYVITLDADSMVIDAGKIVGAMEHPYNVGITVMNIRMRSSLSGLTTPFSALMSGEKGLSNYSSGGGIIFDAYGFGNYTGKGIYRVREFNESLEYAFPDGRILSHDLIEGAFAGCAESGLDGIDEFPKTFSSYLSRMLRWIRGDMQLFPYLFPRVRNRDGNKSVNRASGIAKWQMFMNICSAWSPVSALAVVIVAAVGGFHMLFLFAFAPQILSLMLAFALLPHMTEFATECTRAALNVLWLPTVGLCSLYALCLTVGRLITGRNLLSWKTYASSGGGHCLFVGNMLVSALFIVFGILRVSPLLFALAAVFLAALPLDALLSSEFYAHRVSPKLKRDMLEIAKKTYAYFETTLSENDGLPSDNFQFDSGWADRTSPTNIGMALASACAAHKIGLIDENRRDETIAAILNATESLEKSDGCLYNWYSVKSKKPLGKYVSSVDCGNLAAALLLVASVGGENGKRAEKFVSDMDITRMYDARRNLLYIGYNAETQEPDRGHYDLLASEAMLSYLVFIGCGKLPTKAFAMLSRRALNDGCGRGVLASWSGGMFEYLLPLMFFVPPRRSLVGINAHRIIRLHEREARRVGSDVLGKSESLYGEKYPSGDYKYRAFGVKLAALSSAADRRVFAPYAEIMSCAVTKKGSVEHLEKYAGRYGLYDSVDLDSHTVQYSSMAHHQGMIMLAVCNLLTDDSLCMAMLNGSGARAAALLLEEDQTALKRYERKRMKTYRAPEEFAQIIGGRSVFPQLNFITNGRYCLMTDECGRSVSYADGKLLTRFDKMSGMRVFIKREGFSYEPSALGYAEYRKGSSVYIDARGGLTTEIRAGVLFDKNVEYRRISVQNTSKSPITLSVIVAVKPCISTRDADLSHKAYSAMFIETEACDGYITALRTNGGDGTLALALDCEAEYCGDERALRTGKGVAFGRTTEPILAAVVRVDLSAGERSSFTAKLGYAERGEIGRLMHSALSCDRTGSDRRVTALASITPLSRTARVLAAALLSSHGRNCGVLPDVVMRADTADSGRVLDFMSQLAALEKFGIEFTVTVIVSEPVSYFEGLSAGISRIASSMKSPVRIINELTTDRSEINAAVSGGIDPFALTNRLMPPFYELPPVLHHEIALDIPELEYRTGLGGFTADGEYVIDGETPSPWYNVMSDGLIGCLVSDKGGFTFGKNSRQEKYTVHSNDELNDAHGDGIVLGEGGTLWSITRNPAPHECAYAVKHGFGHSEFSCGYNGIMAVQKTYVHDGAKYYDVTIKNGLSVGRKIDVMCFAEPVLGDHASRTSGGIVCKEDHGVLSARSGNLELRLTCSERAQSFAFFAESYKDRSGKFRACANLHNDGCTPALAYSVSVDLAANASGRVIFVLSAETIGVTAATADKALESVANKYAELPEVESDELPIKYYLKWLSYQTLVSRFTARCGFQQVGGAIGFRDQLQDAMALIGIAPDKVRRHIIDCAAHQFESGDVMHWWHPPAVGVRTRICDDKLFLPLAIAEYIDRTGDKSILGERAAYLKDHAIPDGNSSVYSFMESGDTADTIASHALKAIFSTKLSPRGLVSIGGGDWNDGMDRLGRRGKGESVWCTMFLYYVIGRYMPYVTADDEIRLKKMRLVLLSAIEECFERDRYVRAFDDDGNVIGSENNDECKIDLLVQSWAVISGVADKERAQKVLNTAYDRLFDEKLGIVRLLDPPITDKRIGYIAEYPRGVRENGGQYTHAAVWFAWALYDAGMTEKANNVLKALLPASHTSDRKGVETYLKEPYVLAGDVYYGKLAGRAGWTWYTGAAGWLYRLIVEKYYGLRITDENVRITPNIPVGKIVKLKVRTGRGRFDLTLDGKNPGQWKTYIDGRGYVGATLPLCNLDGKTVLLRREKSSL